MINLSSIQFKFFAESVFSLYGLISPQDALLEIEGDLCEHLDIDSQQLKGQKFTELVVWQIDDCNVDALKDAYNEAKSGKNSKVTLKFRCSAKVMKTIDLKLVPNFTGEANEIFFCITDVTDFQEQIKEFKDRCDHFLYAADIAEVGLWFWNLQTDEIFSTPKCKKIFDISEDDNLTYEHILRVIHPEDQEKVEKKFNESKEHETEYRMQYRVSHSNGNINWISSNGRTLFNEEVNAKTLIGSVRIINDSKAASEELEKIYELEKKAKFEAEKANKTKDFFLALVSHELRSPLNAILGWTQILLKREVDESTRLKALETIERSAKAQSTLIEDLVDSARVTSGKLKLELRPLNLYEILLNVYNSHLPAIEEKGIKHKFICESELVEVIGDTMRLRQVFSNLVGNAIKFTPENGEIILEQTSENENVIVNIKDTGSGIPKDNMALIFNRFAQGDENYSKGQGGLGLGLSLAKILVENHKGTISVESEGKDLGTTFTVKLPVISQMAAIKPENEVIDNDTTTNSINLNGAMILVVEDDEDSRNVLEIYLDQVGAKVESAESVREAFIVLNKPEIPLPDLIISDIGMPDEDGYSFVKKIRSSQEYKQIPTIALSAFTAEENKTKAYEAGFDKYHTKPFEPDLLMQEIIKLIESKKQQ